MCIVHDIDRRIDFMSSLELTDLPIRDGHVSKRSPTTRSKPHDIIIHILFLCKKRTCYLLAYLCRLNLDNLNVRNVSYHLPAPHEQKKQTSYLRPHGRKKPGPARPSFTNFLKLSWEFSSKDNINFLRAIYTHVKRAQQVLEPLHWKIRFKRWTLT